MKSRILAVIMGVSAAFCLATSASAQIRLDRPAGGGMGGGMGGGGSQQQSGIIDRITPDMAARLLQSVGYKGGEPLRFNDNRMQGIRMDLNGNPVAVVLSSCENGGCSSYFFVMDFGKQNISPDFINKYNSNSRFARLFVSSNGSAILQLDGQLFGGVAPANFTLNGALFATAFKALMSN